MSASRMIFRSLTFVIMLVAQVLVSHALPFQSGDVLYCQSIEHVGWSFEDKELTKYILDPFKIFIQSEKDILMKGGSLDGIKMQVEFFLPNKIIAKSTFDTLVLNERELVYAMALMGKGTLITAECDVF